MSDPVGVVAVLAMVAVLLVLRMPIGITLLLAGTVGFSTVRGPLSTFEALGSRLFDVGSGYELSAVPLFLLMGHLAANAEITQDIYKAARAWVGHIKGSLVLATTFAAAGFAACCGSTTSSSAVFGKVAIPEMIRFKVDRRLAAGCVAAVGTLAGMIPPSVNLIVFGLVARQSVPQLLIAGIIPGVMTAVAYGVMIYVRARRTPDLAPPLPPVPRAEKVRSIRGVWGVLVLAVLVMGGIYTGVFFAHRGGGGRRRGDVSHRGGATDAFPPRAPRCLSRHGANHVRHLHHPGRGDDLLLLPGGERRVGGDLGLPDRP